MYIPNHFNVPAKDLLLKLLPEASFATLITSDDEGVPVATHLPVLYDPDAGEQGVISGHVAKTNPHWQLFSSRPSLIIFAGPHAYISPRDYASAGNVPTWNYLSVHAYGTARIVDDPNAVLSLLRGLTMMNEEARDVPWSVDAMDRSRIEAMMKGIVAFEFPIDRLEGKAKLGQNKSDADRDALLEASKKAGMEAWYTNQ